MDAAAAGSSALVHETFLALARARPDARAVSFGDATLSYDALARRSHDLARVLAAEGVGPEAAVAVCLPPSIELVVALLAVFEAGGVYLPLDPTHPPALLARMIADGRPVAIVTTRASSAHLDEAAIAPVLLDGADFPTRARADVRARIDLENAATLFYTSGTTGAPKGVVGTHRNVLHHVERARHAYRFDRDDAFVALARPTFSISLFELLSPLSVGASLHILSRDEVLSPPRLARAFDDATVLHAGPSLLGALFRHLRSPESTRRVFPRVRHASTGGDVVPSATLEEMTRVFPEAEVFVIYGCTEIACMGTTRRAHAGSIPERTLVGAPFPGVDVRLLDERGVDVPRGKVGVVHLACDGVARGYLDRPELTAERFVTREGRRFYATGDLGRFDVRGELELLGRSDFQIKIRGVRIEPLGIEHVVRARGLAAECVVTARRFEHDDDARLVAFVVGPKEANVSAFRRALSAELPPSMLPSVVVVLDALPRTPNGKIDRLRLHAWPLPDAAPAPARTPFDATERVVADAFARALDLDRVDIDDDFFDRGGSSLLATLVAVEIERALGVEVAPIEVLESPTPRALATRLGGDARVVRPILLNGRADATPIFALSGVDAYRPLAHALRGRRALFGVITPRELAPGSTLYSVEERARDAIEILRRERSRGPYRLLGFSFAGIVAFEAARRLRALGEDVEQVVIVDAPLPEWSVDTRRKLEQLRRLARVPVRDLARFAARRARSILTAPVAPPLDERECTLRRLCDVRDARNERAAVDYVARIDRLDAPTLLFAARARIAANPANTDDCGFAPYAPSLEVVVLDGDHEDLLRDASLVARIADAVAAR